MKDFTAEVMDIRLESRVAGVARWQILLSETAFGTGDTGILEAVAPSGTRLVAVVLRVALDEDGEVWHVVEKPLGSGVRVTGRVV